MKRLLIFIIYLFGPCSCRQESEKVPEYAIAAEKMEQLDSAFYSYGYLFLSEADNSLLKSEDKGDALIKKIDLSTGLLKSRIRKGRGPNEYILLRIFGVDAATGSFHVVSPATDELIAFSSEAVSLSKAKLNARLLYAAKLGGCFVSYGDYFADDGKMFLLSDSTGRKITRFGEFPDDGMSYGHKYRTMAHQGKLISNEKRSRFAFLTDMGRVFDIYEAGDDEIPRLIFSIRENLPVYEPQRHVIGVKFRDLMVHYADAYSSDKYIYALYSGKKVEHGGVDVGRQVRETTMIQVFDWEGNHKCNLVTDIPILNLCVSSDDSFMIALYSDEGEVKCCRFALPEALRK